MTAITDIKPAAFASNEEYLGWELGRIQRRVQAFLIAKEQDGDPTQFLQVGRELDTTRPLGIDSRRAAVAAGVDIPFDRLSSAFDLSPKEEEVLLVCLTPHLSSAIWNNLIYAQGSVLKTFLEVGFLSDLVDPSTNLLTNRAWFEAESRLVRSGLLIVEPPSEGGPPIGLLSHAVRAPHYLSAVITGSRPLDERLLSFCDLRTPRLELYDVILSEATLAEVEGFVHGFYRRGSPLDLGQRSWALLVSGPRRSGKTSLAEGLAKAFNRPLLVANLNLFERRPDAAARLELLAQNAQFLGAVLLIVQPEHLLSIEPALMGNLTTLVSNYRGLVVLEPHDTEKLPPEFESLIHFSIELERHDAEEREQLWETLLPREVALGQDVNLSAVANEFGLTGGQIRDAISWAQQRAEARGEPALLSQEDLIAGAKSQVRSKLSQYTDTSRVKLGLEDLILPEEPMGLVNELLDACKHRHAVLNEWGFAKRLATGKGLVALFSGEAGTGKTLCAEIMANELDLRLHIVSIPKVVSKWVGETEKNIRQLFTHARAQNSMLLFDEADSLFTTRVKVEKAQDHFQNMEVNMLLQEIERFEGIVILTTNLETNIDRAFQRRILFKIDFPMPDKEERAGIWKVLIPEQVPLDGDIEYDWLAEAYELSGGQIKNAIIRAAYRCATDGHGLTMEALEEAARQQSKAAGKLFRPADVF
jgi:AAA+ superfamily predicted ATPase